MATNSEAIKEAAAAYLERGFRVIPLHGQKDGCCTCSKGYSCGSAGKHPVWQTWQDPTLTVDLEKDFEVLRNVGIATGAPSGVFVVDIDPEGGGAETMAALVEEHGHLPMTYAVRTGSGGWHYYFSLPDFRVGNSAGTKLGKGVDIRGEGGQVVAPPSISAKGAYTASDRREILDAPQWLLEMIRPKEPVERSSEPVDLEAYGEDRLAKYERAIIKAETDRLLALEPAGWDLPWDQTTFEAACNLIELANADWSELTRDRAAWLVIQAAPDSDGEGWDVGRVEDKIKSAINTVGDEATPPPADRAEQADLYEMAGLPYPTEPQAGVQPGAESTETERRSFTFRRYAHLPLTEDDKVDPEWPKRTIAAELGASYSTARDDIHIEWVDIDEAPTAPFTGEHSDEIVSHVETWLEDSLVAGTPDMFWEAVGAVLTGDALLPAHLTIKGAPSLVEVIVRRLAGVRPGVEESVVHAGISISSVETEESTMVLELESDFGFTEETLRGIAGKATGYYAAARDVGRYSTETGEHDDVPDVGDPRATNLIRTQVGLRMRPRGDANEFNMGG